MAFPVLAAIAIGGALTGAIGQKMGADARADQARREAALKDLQAEETIARAEVNARLTARQGQRLIGAQAAQTGFSGVDYGASQIGGIVETERNVLEQIDLIRQEAQFRARMIREGALSDRQYADDSQTAGTIGAIGSLLSGAGNVAPYMGKGASTPRIE